MATADGDESADLSKLQQSYELLGELSRDERVTVYVARDRSSGKEVAIKVLRAADGAGRESLAHYASDARMLTALEHPNIIAVHAVKWLSEDVVAVVTERVRGPSLRQVLDVAGTLPVARATEVIRGLGRALAWAHSSQIMHRDMRPENVIFEDRTGRVVLSDFGLARRVESVPAAGEPDPYRAPELVDGRYPDRRSDVYSLGIVGWELLTGRRPWADDMEPVLPGERAPDPPPLAEVRPGLPAALVAAIEGAVQLERERRIPDVVTFMERLTGVAPPEPEADEPEEPAQDQEGSFAPTEWVALPVPRMPQRPRPPATDREVSRPVTSEQVASNASPPPAAEPSAPATAPISPETAAEPFIAPAPPPLRTDKQTRSRRSAIQSDTATSPAADQPTQADPTDELTRRGTSAPRGEPTLSELLRAESRQPKAESREPRAESREPSESPRSQRPPSPAPAAPAALSAAAAAAAAAESSSAMSPPSTRRPHVDAPRARPARDDEHVSIPSQTETRAEPTPLADLPRADSSHAERVVPDAPRRERPPARPSERSPERPSEHPAQRSTERAAEGSRPERAAEHSRSDHPLADSPRAQRPTRMADVPLADRLSNGAEAAAPVADRAALPPVEKERDVTERWAAPLSDVELPPPELVPLADMRPEPVSGPISGPIRTPGQPPERFEPAMRGGLATPRLPRSREPKLRDKKRNSSGTPAPVLQPMWDTPVEFPLPAMPDPRPTVATGADPRPAGLRDRFTRRRVTIAAVLAAALIGAVTLARMERAPDTSGELMRPETPAGYGGDVVLERSVADSNEVRGPASASPGGNAARPRGGTNPDPSGSVSPAPTDRRPSGAAPTPAPNAGRATTPTPGTTARLPQPTTTTRQPASGAATNPAGRASGAAARPSTARPTSTRSTPAPDAASRVAPPPRAPDRPAAAVAVAPPGGADARPTGPCGSAALADQRACLAASIERSDASLNQTYGDVIVALRQRASSAPGDPDPPEVQRLRSVQRSWLSRRDAECRRRGRGREGRLWATPRAQCLEEFTTERNRELSAMLGRLRRN